MKTNHIVKKLGVSAGAVCLLFGIFVAPASAFARDHDWNHNHGHYNGYYNHPAYYYNPGWNHNQPRRYENYNGHRGYWGNQNGIRIFINI